MHKLPIPNSQMRFRTPSAWSQMWKVVLKFTDFRGDHKQSRISDPEATHRGED